MATGAAPGEAAGKAGLDFFNAAERRGQLRSGHRQGRHAGAGHHARSSSCGTTTRWPARDTLAGNPPVDVVVPKSGVLAGVYVQAISAYAPHPNAAKLWMEYLYSRRGSAWLAEGLLPPGPLQRDGRALARSRRSCWTRCRPAASYEAAYFPTLEEVDANKAAVTGGWDAVVGANVAVI